MTRRNSAVVVALAIVATAGLSACEKEKGPVEKLGAKIDHAAGQVKEAADEAKEDVKKALDEAREELDEE